MLSAGLSGFIYVLSVIAFVTEAQSPDASATSSDGSTSLVSQTVLTKTCSECLVEAKRVETSITNYAYFNGAASYSDAGKTMCQDVRSVHSCFKNCINTAATDYTHQLKYFERVSWKLCEVAWGQGQQECRMADTLICESRHSKKSCGDNLTQYFACVEDILSSSVSNCSGVCTPAKRYHKANKFEWEAECRLKKSSNSLCSSYAQLYCFDSMKDSDLSWGYFEELHRDEQYRDLTTFCPVAEGIVSCLNNTISGTVDYYGMKISRPCGSVQADVISLIDMWQTIIHPLCAGRPADKRYVDEFCGASPAATK